MGRGPTTPAHDPRTSPTRRQIPPPLYACRSRARRKNRGAGASAPAEAKRGPAVSAGPTGPAAGEDPYAQIRKLQQENEYLRRQRELLEQAMSISAKTRRPDCSDHLSAGRLSRHRTLPRAGLPSLEDL